MNNFSDYNIKDLQMELTTLCNASCPQCSRNICGSHNNPSVELEHINFSMIKKNIDLEIIENLDQLFLCGSYGDPILYPNLFELLDYFKKINPNIYLYIHTNGSIHSTQWWEKLANYFKNDGGRIAFGIDGIGPVHELYRKGTNYERVISNAKAFINAGGNAQWSFIAFKHNEHQVEEAQELSKKLGFSKFLIRKTGRFFDQRNFRIVERWPVVNDVGEIEYYLEPPLNPAFQNSSLTSLYDHFSSKGDFYHYLNTTEIKCDALQGGKINISASGTVLPCCFLYENLFENPHNQFLNSNYKENRKSNQFFKLYHQHDPHEVSLHHSSLKDILGSKLFKSISNSWYKPKVEHGKLLECSITCGKKFTRQKDQYQ